MNEQIVHIQWDGPFTYEQVQTFRGATDYGVYQVHGYHATYGAKVLLYLGKAGLQPFGVRLTQEG